MFADDTCSLDTDDNLENLISRVNTKINRNCCLVQGELNGNKYRQNEI
jgi:hypothetical protein